jgi:hypothetical protein
MTPAMTIARTIHASSGADSASTGMAILAYAAKTALRAGGHLSMVIR